MSEAPAAGTATHRAHSARVGSPQTSTPLPRASADLARKNPGEVTLIGETARKSDLGERQVWVGEQVLGNLHAPLEEPAVGRDADGYTKGTGKMTD